MKSRFTGYITPTEWRWVILFSTVLILIAFLPYIWIALTGTGTGQSEMQFMGAIHRPLDTSADISKILQTAKGGGLTRYLFTPEPQNGNILESMVYIMLGWVAGFTDLDHIVLFHVARIGASLFMYMSIYAFAASIWSKIRTRRIFFTLATISSGLGWLVAPLFEDATLIDLSTSTIYPFQSSLLDVTSPLVIGTMCLLISALITALGTGANESPSVTNSGLTVFLTSLLITLLYPQALIPIAISFFTLILADALVRRNLLARDLRWMLWFGVPALPLLMYYVITLIYNPVTAGVWFQINQETDVTLLNLLVSLGIPLIIALPGIYRAGRHFEPDGNQLMFGWLIAVLLLVVFSPSIKIGFAVGLMIPIAYFGARAIEDFWFRYIPRTQRIRLIVALIPILIISNVFVLLIPIWSLQVDKSPENGMVLPRDYVPVLAWLEKQTNQNSVVLASPDVSAWIPAWVGAHVVYGHPQQTLNGAQNLAAVRAWYSAEEVSPICEHVLMGRYSIERSYRVRYIIVGPLELENGPSACIESLIPVVNFNTVTVYRVPVGSPLE